MPITSESNQNHSSWQEKVMKEVNFFFTLLLDRKILPPLKRVKVISTLNFTNDVFDELEIDDSYLLYKEEVQLIWDHLALDRTTKINWCLYYFDANEKQFCRISLASIPGLRETLKNFDNKESDEFTKEDEREIIKVIEQHIEEKVEIDNYVSSDNRLIKLVNHYFDEIRKVESQCQQTTWSQILLKSMQAKKEEDNIVFSEFNYQKFEYRMRNLLTQELIKILFSIPNNSQKLNIDLIQDKLTQLYEEIKKECEMILSSFCLFYIKGENPTLITDENRSELLLVKFQKENSLLFQHFNQCRQTVCTIEDIKLAMNYLNELKEQLQNSPWDESEYERAQKERLAKLMMQVKMTEDSLPWLLIS